MKIVKLRRNQIAHTWGAQKFREVLRIPSTPNSFGRYEAQLKRIPLYQSPSLTICKFLNTLTSLTETSGTPNSGEYYIDYMPINDSQSFEGSGIITFNAADSGKWIITEYYEVGTFDLEELYDEKQDAFSNMLLRETENPEIANTVFSFPITDSNNPRSQYLFLLTAKNNILKRKYALISSDLYNSYLTLQDGTNNALSGVVNTGYKTYHYLDSNYKIITVGTTDINTKHMYKSVNNISAADSGGFSNLSASMPYFTQFAASVKVGNVVYFFRCSAAHASNPLTKAWKIDLDTNTVTILPDHTDTGIYFWTAVHKDGFIYLVNKGVIQKYDIINNSYSNTTLDFTNFDNYVFGNNETWVENKQGYIQILGHTSDTAGNKGFNIITIDFDNNKYRLTQINNDFNGDNRTCKSKIFSKILENENKLELFNTGYKKPGDNSKVFLSLTENPIGEAFLLTMTGSISYSSDGFGGFFVSIPRCSYKIGGTNYSTTGTLFSATVANGQYVWLTTSGTIGSGAYPTDQKVCPILRVVTAGSTYDSFGIKHTYPEVKKLHSVYFTGFPVDFD